MASQGVLNFEMEASALLVLAALAGCRAGVVCTAYAQRNTGAFVQGEQKERAEAACIATGLEALRILADMESPGRSSGSRALAALTVGLGNGTLSSTQARGARQMPGSRSVTGASRARAGRRTLNG